MSHSFPVDDPETERILDLAEAALDRGEPDAALAYCAQVLAKQTDHAGALYLCAEAHHELGDYPRAEELYRRCTFLVPEHALSWSGLALVLFDQLQTEPARAMAHRALRQDDANAEAYYTRALLRERRGDSTGAARDYRRAWRLEPERYPPPIRLDDATVEAIVTEALTDCPQVLRDALQNVAIVLDELPSDEVCRDTDPPTSPTDILGVFSGPTLMDRNSEDPMSEFPATITLYRKNLERIAWDRQTMLQEVRITLLHEIGHRIGLSEQDLDDRGLD